MDSLTKEALLAWDPDFTKLTEEEIKNMEKAEKQRLYIRKGY